MPEYKTVNSFGNLSFKKRTFNVKTKPKWRMPLHRCPTSKGLKQRNPSSGVAAGAWRPLQPYSWRRGSTRSWHQNSSNTAINRSSPQDSREKASVWQGWRYWRDNLRRSHCEATEEKKLRFNGDYRMTEVRRVRGIWWESLRKWVSRLCVLQSRGYSRPWDLRWPHQRPMGWEWSTRPGFGVCLTGFNLALV